MLRMLILPLVLFPLFLHLHGKWFDEYFFWRWFPFSEEVTLIILAWSTDHASLGGAYLDGKESCFGNSNFTCFVAPPFRALVGLLPGSVENAVRMLSNARNGANTTLIFISNWTRNEFVGNNHDSCSGARLASYWGVIIPLTCVSGGRVDGGHPACWTQLHSRGTSSGPFLAVATPARSIPSSPTILGSPSALFPVPWCVSYKRQDKATLDVNSSISVTFMVLV